MKCRNPFLRAGIAFGCGQCLPCRIKIRRLWTHRILLESCLNKDNAFVTLTYADEHLPKDGLSLDDLQTFLKRFRTTIAPLRIRFYACGEYGDRYGRPHYHLALFGWPSNEAANKILAQCWSRGFIESEPLNLARAKYIAKYVVKKLTDVQDERLCGLNPEFSTKSLKPGLGHGMLPFIAETITRYNLLSAEGDVPVTLAHGGKQYPLGRYLRRALRGHLNGVTDEIKKTPASHVLKRSRLSKQLGAPQSVITALQNDPQMLAVHAAARADKKNPSVKKHLLLASETEIRNVEARYKLFTKKGTI